MLAYLNLTIDAVAGCSEGGGDERIGNSYGCLLTMPLFGLL